MGNARRAADGSIPGGGVAGPIARMFAAAKWSDPDNAGCVAGHGYKISPGTLYPMLHRMQEDGLLTSRQHVVVGRARRVYEIIDLGRAALAEERTALAELVAEILGHREQQ